MNTIHNSSVANVSNHGSDHASTLHNALGLAGLLACTLTLSGCDDEFGDVRGRIDLIDQRSATLASGELEAINGTYGANCTDRTGSWSLEVEVGAALDHSPLSVVLDDTDCVLTMTEVQTSMGGTIEAIPAITLSASFAGSPSSFGVPIDFYANASMDSVSFDSDFVITLLYSDDPDLDVGDGAADFEVVESSASASSVQAPDYSIDTGPLVILVNSEQVVQSASGTIDLALAMGATAGQTYVVVDATGLDTFAELDSAYDAGTPAAIGNVPAAALSLVGEDLDSPVVRTLIIANIQEGVAAYQAFEITFHPAL